MLHWSCHGQSTPLLVAGASQVMVGLMDVSLREWHISAWARAVLMQPLSFGPFSPDMLVRSACVSNLDRHMVDCSNKSNLRLSAILAAAAL